MIPKEDIELIWKFIDDDLSESELHTFKDKLENDKKFGKEVARQMKLVALFKATKSSQEKMPAKTIRYWFTRRYLIAASVFLALFAGGLWLLFFQDEPAHESLFTEYYTAYQINIYERSSDNYPDEVSNLFDRFINAYESQKYNECIIILKQIIEKEPGDIAIRFYMGYCYLNTLDLQAAVSSFQYVISEGDNIFLDEASWYLSLTYLKQGNKKLCRDTLYKIIATDGFYRSRAKELIKKL